MGKSNYLCPCMKISKSDIKKAIANGADSFKKVKKATNAAKRCGHCACDVKTYTKKQLKKNKK